VKRGARSIVGGVVGLALMQLILSSSEGSGQAARGIAWLWAAPAKWLSEFVDPGVPAIPDTGLLASAVKGATGSTSTTGGLSGTPTTTGTGSYPLAT
jgi:hypothetical protein